MGSRAISSKNTAKAMRSLRRTLFLTQKQLAERFNVSVSAIKTWETGRAMPSLSNCKMILEYLSSDDCPLDWIAKMQLKNDIITARNKDIQTAETVGKLPANDQQVTAGQATEK